MRVFVATLLMAMTATAPASAQTDTTFTYQGQLNESGSPANGTYGMDFLLFDVLSGGSQIGSTITIAAQSVSDGVFDVELDFGVQNFASSQHWLEIIVDGDTLAPRIPITGSPFSVQTRGMQIGGDGNVTFNSMEAIEGFFTLSSIGGIDMVIDADTNNVGEDQNARIVMRQDGGVVASRMGYREATNRLEIMQEYGDNLILGTNNIDRLTIGLDGNVGIGTFPDSNISLFAAGVESVGIEGRSYLATSTATGVKGLTTATSGISYGVHGQAASTSGFGVFGGATAATGITYGVYGRSDSYDGRGVFGYADAAEGFTYGVYGRNESVIGAGVYGLANSTEGIPIGVQGESKSSNGFDFYASGAGANYGSSSSIRWKSNITDIESPLDKLSQLRGVYYDWDEEHGGQRAIGMIAEEVGKVLPEIVGYEENGVDAIGMDYSMLTPLLVEATNALRAEKDAEIADLHKRITELEHLIMSRTQEGQSIIASTHNEERAK